MKEGNLTWLLYGLSIVLACLLTPATWIVIIWLSWKLLPLALMHLKPTTMKRFPPTHQLSTTAENRRVSPVAALHEELAA